MKISACFGKSILSEISAEFNLVGIDPAGAAEGKIVFSFPVADIHRYWASSLLAPCDCLPWEIVIESAFQKGMPFITFFNVKGVNQLAAGPVGLFCDQRIEARMNQETGCYDIVFLFKGESALPPFKFLLDFRHIQWRESVAVWRRMLSPGKYCFPESVWDPVYCTWYAIHGAMTEAWCDRAAAVAGKLGFGTFILDDGWCYPEKKRYSPSTSINWFEKVGDWLFDPEKFPDAAAHIGRVQKLGMKYMVWIAPYLVGKKSRTCQELETIPGAFCGDSPAGCRILDTRCEEACRLMLNRVEEVMKRYHLDGLKVDFLDRIYPDMKEPKSESCMNFTAELAGRIRQINPEAMIEFRQGYSMPQMVPYGTQFRAGDCPFDFMMNFRRISIMRTWLGDGIPVHADPACWPAAELPVNIARHFISMMAGVPMLSIDFDTLSEETKNLIAFWVEFYRKNSAWLRNARWEFDYSGGMPCAAWAEGADRTLAIVADEKRVPEFRTPGWLLNLSPERIAWDHCRAFDYDGTPVSGCVIPLGGGAWRD